MDPRFGHFVNHDLAEYHIAANADVARARRQLARRGRPARQPDRAPRASARSASSAPRPPIANAVYHATGVRVRDLPIRPDRVLEGLV